MRLDFPTSRQAYSDAYSPDSHYREGRTFRAARRPGARPTPHPSAKNAATGLPAVPAAYWWACALVLGGALALFAAVLHWASGTMQTGRDASYCAAVYSGAVPDWRGTYFDRCDGPKLKKPAPQS